MACHMPTTGTVLTRFKGKTYEKLVEKHVGKIQDNGATKQHFE
jgi:hypothetical protein